MSETAVNIISPIHGSTGNTAGRKPIEIPTQELLDAIDGSYGNVTVICQRLGVSRNTALKNIAGDEEASQAFNDERHALVDAAEKATLELIRLGDAGMVRFVLSSKFAQNRGWGTAQQPLLIEGANVYTGETERKDEGRGGAMLVLSLDKIEEIEKVILSQI